MIITNGKPPEQWYDLFSDKALPLGEAFLGQQEYKQVPELLRAGDVAPLQQVDPRFDARSDTQKAPTAHPRQVRSGWQPAYPGVQLLGVHHLHALQSAAAP